MRGQKTLFWASVGLLLLSAVPTMGSIHDDYAQLEAARKVIETQRRQLENESRSLEERRRLAEKKHFECACGKWRVLWQKRVNEANKAREELEKQNERLNALNRFLRELNNQLELKRREIESMHKDKDSAYENAIRAWMNRVETEYFFRLTNELFEGYREYINGIEKYLIFVNSSAEQCLNRNYGQAALEMAEGHVTDILKAVKAIKDIFSKGG